MKTPALSEKSVQDVKRLKAFLNLQCKGDQAKFINAFEHADEKLSQKACKALKIQPGESILKTAKQILKEIANGKSTEKNQPDNSSTSDNDNKLENDMENVPTSSEKGSFDTIELKIDPEIDKLIPKPSTLQYQFIKADIKKYGMTDPIAVKADGTIVDGHTRYRIMKELKREIPQDKIVLFEGNIEQHIKSKNIARRHISNLSKIDLVKADIEKLKKSIASGREQRKQISKTANVPESTVQKVQFLEKYSPDRLSELDPEQNNLNKLYQEEHDKYLAVKKDKELFKQLKKGEIPLNDAFELVQKQQPEPKEEKPKELSNETFLLTSLIELKEYATRKIKKYHNNKYVISDTPDGRALKEIMEKLDSIIYDLEC